MGKKPISSEYNLIEWMRENAETAFSNLKKVQLDNGYVDLLKGNSPGQGLKLFQKQGLHYHDQFKFTEEFKAKLSA